MNRRALINELVNNGYEAGVLDSLNNSELALLAQEEFIVNHWTDAARAAAKAGRNHHVFLKGGRNDSEHGEYIGSHYPVEARQMKITGNRNYLSKEDKKQGMRYHVKTSTQLNLVHNTWTDAARAAALAKRE